MTNTTTNHIYEVYDNEDFVLDVLRFDTPEDAAEFAGNLNEEYSIRPQTLSAEELLEIALDMIKYEQTKKANAFIGQISVDSGILMITDPCYIMDEITDEDLEDIHRHTDNELKSGQVPGGFKMALQPGHGDGIYDVYAKFNRFGKIVKVEINME